MKKNLVLLFALLVSLFMVACQKEDDTNAGDVTDKGNSKIVGYEDTVNIGYMADLDSADPYQSSSSQCALFTNSTFRTLTMADPQTGELVLVLAESVKDVSGDNTCFEVGLKKGVKFHDGNELTADDVIFTWEYAKNAQNVIKPISSADVMVKSVEKVDESTVRFNLNYSIPDFAYYLEIKVYSKEAFDTMDVASAGVIGCGPYKAGKMTSGVSFAMERFDDYYEGIDNYPTKNIVFKVLPEDNSQAAALQAGDIDYVVRINSASAQTLLSDKKLNVVTSKGLMSYYIGFKFLNDSKWNNPELRKAIAMAVNKEDIVNIQFNGGVGGVVNNNFCLTSGVGYADVNYIKYNPDAAKEKLEELGYANMEVTIMTVDAYKAAAVVLQSNLNAIGVVAKIKVVDATNWPALKVSEDYDIDIGDYGTYSGAMLYNFDRFFSKEGSSNMRGFYSEEFEALMANCRAANNLDDMSKQFAVMQQWVAENVPFIPYAVNNGFTIARVGVEGVETAGADNVTHVETLCKPIYE